MQIFNSDVVCTSIQTTDNKTSDILLMITPTHSQSFKPIEWISSNRDKIEAILHRNGGVLLRNCGIHSVSEFNKIAQSLYPNLLDYTYRLCCTTPICHIIPQGPDMGSTKG